MLFRRLVRECHLDYRAARRLTLSQAVCLLRDDADADDPHAGGLEIRGQDDWDALLRALDAEEVTDRE